MQYYCGKLQGSSLHYIYTKKKRFVILNAQHRKQENFNIKPLISDNKKGKVYYFILKL